MDLVGIIGVINVTALMIAGVMVALVILPIGKDIVGDKRNWVLLIGLCMMLAVRGVLKQMEPAWIQVVRALLGIGAAILFPWVLWKLYRGIRPKPESEKTG
jgi:DMSO/TMAO reductase YedYZ heme-binding membrane subunit